jgi:hypothetical protein
LIKFYDIPLLQTWVYDHQAFRELAEGTLTEAMFEELQLARAYNWQFHPVSAVRKVKRGTHPFLEVQRDDGNIELTIQLP